MKKILFQGDSITDTMRSRDNEHYRGSGYATLVSASLSLKYPAEYEFLNRGISGNRIVDLYQRIKCDFINLAPDYISILIGINDVWHEINYQNGVSPEKFEKVYNMLIEELKEALPECKIMILEPFLLKGTATEASWERFKSDTKMMAEAAKRVAEKNSLPFISLYNEFFELEKIAPSSFWLTDGVHPTAGGHEFIKTKWIEAFENIK